MVIIRFICCKNTPLLGLGMALIIILTHLNCVRNKAQGGWGGRLGEVGGGKIIHTIHTHIDLEKFFQILAFFLSREG